MIFYGDRERVCYAHDAAQTLLAQAMRLDDFVGQARIDVLTHVLIDTGSLAQALQDREHARLGHDELTDMVRVSNAACAAAARAMLETSTHFTHACTRLARALEALAACAPRELVHMRCPEGYAFYALYPQQYAEAARAWARAHGPNEVQVIGIRSIGCSLAAVVAAALDSPFAPLTVRPIGHPFSRRIEVGPVLAKQLATSRDRRHYAVVDEGPGLSGSSFDAVASYLRVQGVAPERLLFFPSHDAEPGAQASDAARERYRATTRTVVSFEQHFDGRDAEHDLPGLFADVTGPLHEPPLDLSAGRWRALHYPASAALPPSYMQDERRKLLLRSASGDWLLKYAGLGGLAPRIAERATQLSRARLTPERLTTRHGFSLTRFHHDALPLPRADVERALLVEQVALHLRFLTRHFPLDAASGATPRDLFEMLMHNARELLGSEHTEGLRRYQALLPSLQTSHRPTALDGKLEPYEWIVLSDGSLRKCDAEDHHAGHDCVGAQDPAWDLAGARIELGFSDAEHEQVLAGLHDHCGYTADVQKLSFFELAYCAFRAARAHYGEGSVRGWADEEAARLRAERERYTEALRSRL